MATRRTIGKKAGKKKTVRKKASTRRRTPKVGTNQADLIDVDDPADKPLIQAAKKYLENRNAWQRLSDRVSEDKTKVIDLMRQRGKTHYRHEGIDIVVEDTIKLKVKLEDDE